MDIAAASVPLAVPGDWLGPECPQHWWCVYCGAWAKCGGQISRSALPASDRSWGLAVGLDSAARRASLCRGGSTQCCTAQAT
jgi:hypothetical protein